MSGGAGASARAVRHKVEFDDQLYFGSRPFLLGESGDVTGVRGGTLVTLGRQPLVPRTRHLLGRPPPSLPLSGFLFEIVFV